MSNKLNNKQKKFCLEYLKDFNATQSAIRAGYSKDTANRIGSRLLTNVDIQDYIKELNSKVEKKAIMDIQEIQERLTKMARGELEEDIVVVTGDGDGYSSAKTITKKVCAKDQSKALELLGKSYGMFVEKAQVNLNTNNQKDLNNYLEAIKNGELTNTKEKGQKDS